MKALRVQGGGEACRFGGEGGVGGDEGVEARSEGDVGGGEVRGGVGAGGECVELVREDGGLGLLDFEGGGAGGQEVLEVLEARGGGVGREDWGEEREVVVPVVGDGQGRVVVEELGEVDEDAGGEGVGSERVEGEVFVVGLADEELF